MNELSQLLAGGVEISNDLIKDGKMLVPEFQDGEAYVLCIGLKNLNTTDSSWKQLAFKDYNEVVQAYKEIYHKSKLIKAKYPSLDTVVHIMVFVDGENDLLGREFRLHCKLCDWARKQDELDKMKVYEN